MRRSGSCQSGCRVTEPCFHARLRLRGEDTRGRSDVPWDGDPMRRRLPRWRLVPPWPWRRGCASRTRPAWRRRSALTASSRSCRPGPSDLPGDIRPASTLAYVTRLARPGLRVEVEAWAARPPRERVFPQTGYRSAEEKRARSRVRSMFPIQDRKHARAPAGWSVHRCESSERLPKKSVDCGFVGSNARMALASRLTTAFRSRLRHS
jgi:hypothetical protein